MSHDATCDRCYVCRQELSEENASDVFWWTKDGESCSWAIREFGTEIDDPDINVPDERLIEVLMHMHRCSAHTHAHICSNCLPNFERP